MTACSLCENGVAVSVLASPQCTVRYMDITHIIKFTVKICISSLLQVAEGMTMMAIDLRNRSRRKVLLHCSHMTLHPCSPFSQWTLPLPLPSPGPSALPLLHAVSLMGRSNALLLSTASHACGGGCQTDRLTVAEEEVGTHVLCHCVAFLTHYG